MADKNELILIVGGGPAGLAAALAFDNNNYKNIVVLEGRTDMNFDVENSYPVGVNVRGQTAIKTLFGSSNENSDVSNLGLRVDQWKILVGPGINVANFESGLVVGTSRAGVTNLLYDETQRRGTIKVLFGHRAMEADLKAKTVKCAANTGEEKIFKPVCLIIADGYKSKVRDSIEKSDQQSLQIQRWPWNISFRVLTSEINPKTELNPYIHYIQNQIYISKFLNGKWTAAISIKENSPAFLLSNEATEENMNELEKYVKKVAPITANLFTRDEYKRYFSRSIFTGSVTKVSKLVIDKWAVLIGDSAHSAFPATGEGINSALEDGSILQKCLQSNTNNLEESLVEFEKSRLEDANALSDMAYGAVNQNFKGSIQMIFLGLFKRFIGPSKEELLFGKSSNIIQKYSDVVKIWKHQTRCLGGPNIPK